MLRALYACAYRSRVPLAAFLLIPPQVDIDVGSSSVASAIVSLVAGYATRVTVDLAFVLEGQRPAELPERLLGVLRVSHPDLTRARKL